MKKTTMRIAGFALLAVFAAFMSSCQQPAAPKIPGLAKANLKGSTWQITEHFGIPAIGNAGYFLAFSDEKTPKLRIGYDDDIITTPNDAKTRAKEVECTVSDDKITVKALDINNAKIEAKRDSAGALSTLTITIDKDKKIVLNRFSGPIDFTADNSPGDVIKAFNEKLLKLTWGGASEVNKVWQVMKIKGIDVSAKDLYIKFSANDKVTLITKEKKAANAESNYSINLAKHLSDRAITITALDITDQMFKVSGKDGSRVISILKAGNEFELNELNTEKATVVNGWGNGTETPAALAALFNAN